MNSHSSGPALVAASVITAVFCTVLLAGGWLIWVPVLAAILVVAALKSKVKA